MAAFGFVLAVVERPIWTRAAANKEISTTAARSQRAVSSVFQPTDFKQCAKAQSSTESADHHLNSLISRRSGLRRSRAEICADASR